VTGNSAGGLAWPGAGVRHVDELTSWAMFREGDSRLVKVKLTPVQALRLCTGRTAHRGSRGIALPSHDERH